LVDHNDVNFAKLCSAFPQWIRSIGRDTAGWPDPDDFVIPEGGAVFSVGSISWCGSLPINAFENNVSRITENVLRRFMTDEKF
jgi:hypothetical protein